MRLKSILFISFFLLLPLTAHEEVEVFTPDDLETYPGYDDKPMLKADYQAQLKESYKEKYYRIWSLSSYNSSDTKAYLKGLLSRYQSSDRYYAQNKRPWNQKERDRYIESADISNFPSMLKKGITLHATDARLLPTLKPMFLDHALAGEGYPFDYLQNSSIWPSTPLLIVHQSTDKAWYYCVAPYVEGWIRAKDIAFVSDDFIDTWTRLETGVLIEDEIALEVAGRYITTGYIGTVLPIEKRTLGGYQMLLADDDGKGNAIIEKIQLSSAQVADRSFLATRNNFHSLITKLYGSPYGWGGAYFTRDCSALLRDIYAPFGIWLPRNSGSQIEAGEVLYNFKSTTKRDKYQELRDNAIPYLSTIYKPGHIVMYLGTHQNVIMIYHSVWGVKTDNLTAMGRYIIGGTTITSLNPGIELPYVNQTLIDGFTKYNIVIDTLGLAD